jgi:hypothetical protein
VKSRFLIVMALVALGGAVAADDTPVAVTVVDQEEFVHVDVINIEEVLPPEKNLAFKGGIRLRGEAEENFVDFGSEVLGTDDDSGYFMPYRAQLGMLGRLPKDIYGFIDLQAWGWFGNTAHKNQRPFPGQGDDEFSSTDANVDLFQAWIKMDKIGGTNSELILGRSKVALDREFLLGDLDFYNGTSHDGFRYRWANDDNAIDGFWYVLEAWNVPGLGEIGEVGQYNSNLVGAHWTNTGWIDGGDVSAYLYYNNFPQENLSDDGSIDMFTVGARTGKHRRGESGFIWNAELAGQFGTIAKAIVVPDTADADIMAYGAEGMFGYNFSKSADHEVFGRMYYASGDDDPTDDKNEVFNPLFQDFHNRLGIADAVPNTNIASFSIGYNFRKGAHRLGVELFDFALVATESQDQFDYGFGFESRVGHGPFQTLGACSQFVVSFECGGRAVTGTGSDDKGIGQEFDILYDYHYSKHLKFNVGMAFFMPGEAIKVNNGGNDDTAHRIYAQAVLNF